VFFCGQLGMSENEYMSLTGGLLSAKAFGYNYNKSIDAGNFRRLYALTVNLNRKKGANAMKDEDVYPLFHDNVQFEHKEVNIELLKKIHSNGS
jgi:hypothetical protein